MKILHFIYGLHIGGAESFLRNLILSLEGDTQYDFFFVVQDEVITNEFFNKYREKLGSSHFFTIPKFPRYPLRQFIKFRELLLSERFDLIHLHVNSLANPIPIIVANSLKIPIIVHSHNTCNAEGGKLGTLLHKLHRKFFNFNSLIKLACTEQAGYWMFKDKPFKAICNAIPIDKFKFDDGLRTEVRNELHIDDTTCVIGMVGRLHPQKNYYRAIDIFCSVLKIHPNSKLLIVGDGLLKVKIIEYARSRSVYDSVILIGAKEGVHKYYCASDVFLFPSLYEGLGIVGIEAQASGLNVIASDNVPKDMDISGSVKFISLNSKDDYWANQLINNVVDSYSTIRIERNNKLRNCHYSLAYLANSMSTVYNEIKKNR